MSVGCNLGKWIILIRFLIQYRLFTINGRTLMLNKYFEYRKHKTNFKTEVIAGVTTFLTMAYIMFLNPFILSGEFAGTEKGFFDFGAVFTAKF